MNFACDDEASDLTPIGGSNSAEQSSQSGETEQAGNQSQAGYTDAGTNIGTAGTDNRGGESDQAGVMEIGGNTDQMNQAGTTDSDTNNGQAGSNGMNNMTPLAGQQCGIQIKPQVPHSGVVYAASYGQGRLDWYRTDMTTPQYENSLPLSSGTIDMLIDGDNDRLFVLHDVTREAVWFTITRPTSPAEALLNGPQEIGRLSFTNMPVRFALDRVRNRLFTLTQPPLSGNGEPVRNMVLEITDVSNPMAPVALQNITVPSATAIAIDSQRGLMIMYAHLDETLLAFDVTSPMPRPLPELTFDLEARFNEPSQTAFNLKGFRLDESRGMLYAARDQVPNSQALVFEYTPASSAQDGCVDLSPFTVRTDPIDQSIPPTDRTNLMGAAVVEPILGKSGVFFVFAAWNGSMAQPMVTMLDDTLNFEPSCGEFATNADIDNDFGCFISGSAYEDKGVCVDASNQVAAVTVATGVSFFSFDTNRILSPPVVIEQGAAATLVCH